MSIGQIFKNALDDVSVKFSWFLTRMFRYTDHDRGYFTVDAELEDGKPLRIVESIVRSEALLVTEAPDILDRLIKTRGLKDYNAFLSGQEDRLAEERAKLAGAPRRDRRDPHVAAGEVVSNEKPPLVEGLDPFVRMSLPVRSAPTLNPNTVKASRSPEAILAAHLARKETE